MAMPREISEFLQMPRSVLSHMARQPCLCDCVTHKSAITDHAVEENHVIDWDKAKVVDREAQMDIQMDSRGTLDQEDTDVHESGCRILPTQPHMGPGNFRVMCSIKL